MRKVNWLTGALILTMPISLIFFLGSQMAYGQVQRRYESYAAIPQITSAAELQALAEGVTVLLRGQIGAATVKQAESGGALLIYQERPLDGREVRYLEEFPLTLPTFTLQLTDRTLDVVPSQESAAAISHELHREAVGDREFTGFQAGDVVSVQGKWQPAANAQSAPQIIEVTGISGAEGEALLAELQSALQKVRLARDALGFLTLVSILALVIQLRRQRNRPSAGHQTRDEEAQEWHPTTETAPSI